METLKHSSDKYYILFNIISKISCLFSNKIIVYSASLIKSLNLVKYKKKIIIAPRHFIDFNLFKLTKPFNQRKNLVGYIGRFSKEKAVENFIKSIPIISEKNDDVNSHSLRFWRDRTFLNTVLHFSIP